MSSFTVVLTDPDAVVATVRRATAAISDLNGLLITITALSRRNGELERENARLRADLATAHLTLTHGDINVDP